MIVIIFIMKHYEMLCVLPGTLAEAEVAPVIEQVSQVLGGYEASNVTLEDMGKSKLAYPIKHIRYGYFQLFRFELEEKNLAKLEHSVRLLGTMLRVIVRVTDPAKTAQYTLAQDPTALSAPQKEDPRDTRGKRGKREEERGTRDEKKVEEAPTKEVATEEKKEVSEKPTEKIVEEKPAEESKPAEKPKEEKKAKKEKTISIEDIDQKLDELLQKDIENV